MNLKEAMAQAPMDLRQLTTKLPGQDEPSYYAPMTLADHDKIARHSIAASANGEPSQGLTLAMTVIHKVVNEKGDKLFSASDRRLLMEHCPNSIIVDLVNEIAEPVDLEHAEGN